MPADEVGDFFCMLPFDNKAKLAKLLKDVFETVIYVPTMTGNLLVGQYLAEHIPSAEFKTVDGSVHMLFWQKPTETCSAIVEFLRRD